VQPRRGDQSYCYGLDHTLSDRPGAIAAPPPWAGTAARNTRRALPIFVRQVIAIPAIKHRTDLHGLAPKTHRTRLCAGLSSASCPSGLGDTLANGNYLLFAPDLCHPPVRPGGAAWVSGHLAGIKLATGQITQLPVPTYSSNVAPVAPLEAAW
jgi:hypothetical protein